MIEIRVDVVPIIEGSYLIKRHFSFYVDKDKANDYRTYLYIYDRVYNIFKDKVDYVMIIQNDLILKCIDCSSEFKKEVIK